VSEFDDDFRPRFLDLLNSHEGERSTSAATWREMKDWLRERIDGDIGIYELNSLSGTYTARMGQALSSIPPMPANSPTVLNERVSVDRGWTTIGSLACSTGSESCRERIESSSTFMIPVFALCDESVRASTDSACTESDRSVTDASSRDVAQTLPSHVREARGSRRRA
jgi:hypothetical protein